MRFWTPALWARLAALCGLFSVAFGAFAAHGAQTARAAELLRTGALYGFVHALAVLACAGLAQAGASRVRFAPGFFLAGTLMFSGSLYALAFGAPRWLGMVTPLGGVCLMAGWAVLAWAVGQLSAARRP